MESAALEIGGDELGKEFCLAGVEADLRGRSIRFRGAEVVHDLRELGPAHLVEALGVFFVVIKEIDSQFGEQFVVGSPVVVFGFDDDPVDVGDDVKELECGIRHESG
jgi:hypothetical protein